MRFLWNSFLVGFLVCGVCYAADVKITALPEDTAPTGDDLTVTVDAPSGTPATKKSTLSNLSKGLTVTSMISACTDAQVLGGNAAGTGVECQADADTNANTICSGTTTYLDGEGNCDDIASAYAPIGVNYLVGTANGSLSSEIAVGTSPGGELGGTWASPTIDDSITVTGWVMGASTATTPSADDNDTSLATTAYVQTELNAAGGRSLSCASGSCDADAELYTRTYCYRMIYPIATDDDKSIWANKTANDFLITEIWAESDQTVAFDLQVDDGTPADVNGTDITPAAGEAEDTSLSGDTTVAAGEELDLAITSVTNTPTWFTVCWTGTWAD